MYVELHSRSAFSFLEGASIPEELIAVCANLGMPAMALLDRDGVYGSPRFHLAAKKAKIKAHIGAEVTCAAFSPNGYELRAASFEQTGGSHLAARSPCLLVNFGFRCWLLRALAIKIFAA
jgi:DNA polymerase III alpha subunit